MHRNKGFTLIEISIVLVIIGLIVGGVLVGRDLIKAAEIRSTIAELDKMNAAMNTFRLKYNNLPGDLEANKAAQFGMASRSGADGHGDGDGFWEGCSSSAVGQLTVFGCETALIWRDLSDAQLVDGTFNTATDALTSVPAGNQEQYFPESRLRKNLYYTTFSYSGFNFIFLSNIGGVDASGQYLLSNTSGNLTPREAQAIDQKLDDERPWKGRILGASNATQILGSATAQPSTSCTTCSCLNFAAPISQSVTLSTCAAGNNCSNNVVYNSRSSVNDSRHVCQISHRIQ